MDLLNRRPSLRIAIAAALAGLAWGYLRHRRRPRQTVLAVLQAAEWFVAAGGAAAVIVALRGGLEPAGDEVTERVTHATQTVTDHAAG